MKLLLSISIIIVSVLTAFSASVAQSTTYSTANRVAKSDEDSAAQQYILPTAIPSQQIERKTLVKQLSDTVDPQQKKVVLLTRLALITSQTSASLEGLELLQKDMDSLRLVLPKDPELMAAHGSLIAFKSVFFLNDLSTLSVLSRQGNRLMDRAVKLNPNHLGTRLQRGIACANMPSYVRRARYAITDLELLQEKVGEHYGTEFKQFIEYYLALAYSRNQQVPDARELWQKISAGEGIWSQKSKLALKDL